MVISLSHAGRKKSFNRDSDVGELCEGVLAFLKDRKPKTIEEIAERFNLSPDKTDEIMIILEEMNLVERDVKIRITDVGDELL